VFDAKLFEEGVEGGIGRSLGSMVRMTFSIISPVIT
jgi:hypothetical protein